MEQPFPPCPVCEGAQAFFNVTSREASIILNLGFWNQIKLGALICLTCGHTELRPHPHDMAHLRASAAKRGAIPPQF